MGSRLLKETNPTPSPVIERLEARIAELEKEAATARAEGERRVLREFAEWCELKARLCAFAHTEEEWAQRAGIARYFAYQRAQANQGDSNG